MDGSDGGDGGGGRQYQGRDSNLLDEPFRYRFISGSLPRAHNASEKLEQQWTSTAIDCNSFDASATPAAVEWSSKCSVYRMRLLFFDD